MRVVISWSRAGGAWGRMDGSMKKTMLEFPEFQPLDEGKGIYTVESPSLTDASKKITDSWRKAHPFSSDVVIGIWASENSCWTWYSGAVFSKKSFDLKAVFEVAWGENADDIIPPKSQKIIGLFALDGVNNLLHTCQGTRLVSTALKSEADLAKVQFGTKVNFARGCPLRPRHGFVDSRKVSTKEDLKKVWDEVRVADPEGEMLISEFIDSEFNIIWTPTAVSIGPGHDGATAGRNSILIPLVKGNAIQNSRYTTLVKAAKIAEKEVPYIEAVFAKIPSGYHWQATQCRSGPEINAQSPDYIPEPYEVKEVVDAEGDLLEWEAKAEKFQPGTVVYHSGGTLASHYAVHCVNHKIPYVTTKRPQVGEILQPTAGPGELDLEQFTKGIVAGFTLKLSGRPDWARAATFLLVALHHMAAQRGEYSWALGAAASLMCRLGLGLALGELRHYSGSSLEDADKLVAAGLYGKSRDQIYALAFNDYFVYRLLYAHTVDGYYNYSWGGSYGGKKWGQCTTSVAALDSAILAVMQNPSQATAKKLVDALNWAVTQAHNGGWWLNKLVNGEVLQLSSDTWFPTVIQAAPIYYRLFQELTVNKGNNTVAPLLRFLPPIEVSTAKRKYWRKTDKWVTDPTVDVPQVYDLSYPIRLVDEPLPPQEEVKIAALQVRLLDPDALTHARFQVRWSVVGGSGSHAEYDFKIPEKIGKWIKEQKHSNKSMYGGSTMQYVPLEDFALKVSGAMFTVTPKILDWSLDWLVHFKSDSILKKKKPPVEWWKPGVKIPVTWKAHQLYKETWKEYYSDGTEVPPAHAGLEVPTPAGVPDLEQEDEDECANCGNLVPVGEFDADGNCKSCQTVYCDSCDQPFPTGTLYSVSGMAYCKTCKDNHDPHA